MAKAATKHYNSIFYAVIVILVIAIGLLTYLYAASQSAWSQALASAKSNYTALQTYSQTHIANLQNQLNSTKFTLNSTRSMLANVTSKYNAAEYNLTHPFTEILYNDKIVNIPPETSVDYYNYSFGEELTSYVFGEYNFSFNVPYDGYLIFNETNTGLSNNQSAEYFEVGINTFPPQTFTTAAGQSYHDFNDYFSPGIKLYPAAGESYIIPVRNGTNYVIFYNYNYNQGITVTFSMKYVGFRTS